MKKCVLVNCFASSNEMRVEPIREVLDERGYETIYISSDFHHALKKYVPLDKSIVPIRVRSYKKNLSIDRLLSHKEFSKEVYEFLCKEKPELIYIKFPPNSLVKAAYDYKKNYKSKIILDLFDLWPESLPVPSKVKKAAKPALNVWANYRDKYISCADLVLTECDMYREVLKDILPENTHTLYLSKEDIDYHFTPPQKGKIRLCYLGGINNLIDLKSLELVVDKLKKYGEISIDIIGDGVNRNALIRIFEDQKFAVRFHGIIYDETEKNEIMSQCDFGINLVKKTVNIALSIKSIEYFRAGLGVINNVPYDTWNLIKTYNAGVNISKYIETLGLSYDLISNTKKNARNVYRQLFERRIAKEKFSDLLRSSNYLDSKYEI